MTNQIENYDIYVDGSAIKQVPVASSWGYVCISQNKMVKEDYGVSKKHLESSNIVGEVTAVYTRHCNGFTPHLEISRLGFIMITKASKNGLWEVGKSKNLYLSGINR